MFHGPIRAIVRRSERQAFGVALTFCLTMVAVGSGCGPGVSEFKRGLDSGALTTDRLYSLERGIRHRLLRSAGVFDFERRARALPPEAGFSEDRLREYEDWTDRTVRTTTNGGPVALIAEKATFALHVIEDGKVVDTVPADFGDNFWAAKKAKGDRATPHGMYWITEKTVRKDPNERYVLEISYPRAKTSDGRTVIVGTGGDIQIHTGGTSLGMLGMKVRDPKMGAGCITLMHDDFLAVAKRVRVGDRVTIVPYGFRVR
jgi:hypothetical protein